MTTPGDHSASGVALTENPGGTSGSGATFNSEERQHQKVSDEPGDRRMPAPADACRSEIPRMQNPENVVPGRKRLLARPDSGGHLSSRRDPTRNATPLTGSRSRRVLRSSRRLLPGHLPEALPQVSHSLRKRPAPLLPRHREVLVVRIPGVLCRPGTPRQSERGSPCAS
jgi:hypothetical protein